MTPQTGAMVYRFRDTIAIHTQCSGDPNAPSCPTIYLPADLAEQIGNALIHGAYEIQQGTPFTESEFVDHKLGDHE